MEKQNLTQTDYKTIEVPANLYFSLDNNLRNALTVLIYLSSVFADSQGYFFRTNEDLQNDFKMGKNLTIAVLESLYQYGLLSVKSAGFTRKNGKKQVNFYRLNVERFADYEQYHIYTITKNEELHLNTVDYKSKGFKVTYTSSTENASTSVENDSSEEIPSNELEKPTEAKEIALNETVDDYTVDELDESEVDGMFLTDIYGGDCPLLDSELEELVKPKQTVIETACIEPKDTDKIEYRSICTSKNIDPNVIGKCYDLVNRYCEMEIPSSTQALNMCNAAIDYINKQAKKGLIEESDRKRLQSVLIQSRFKKHRI